MQNLNTQNKEFIALKCLQFDSLINKYEENFRKQLERDPLLNSLIARTMEEIAWAGFQKLVSKNTSDDFDPEGDIKKLKNFFQQMAEIDYENKLADFSADNINISDACSQLSKSIFDDFKKLCEQLTSIPGKPVDTDENYAILKSAILKHVDAKVDNEKQTIYELLVYLSKQPDITIYGVGRKLDNQPDFVNKNDSISRFHFLLISSLLQETSFIINCGSLIGVNLSTKNFPSTDTDEQFLKSNEFRITTLKNALQNKYPNSKKYKQLNDYIAKLIAQPLPKIYKENTQEIIHLQGVASYPLALSIPYNIEIPIDILKDNDNCFKAEAGKLIALAALANKPTRSIFFDKNNINLDDTHKRPLETNPGVNPKVDSNEKKRKIG